MKSFSIFQIVILASFAALAVAGVLIFAFLVGGSRDATVGEVEIWGTLSESAYTTVMRQLAEEDSRLRQVKYVQKNADTFDRELLDALASGQGPDIVVLRHDYILKDGSKMVTIPFESFPKEQFESTFVDAAYPFLSAEGVVGVPFAIDPMVLYWNKDMLGTAGFAKPPQYWDEMFAIGSQATRRDPTNSIEKSGVALGEYTNVTHAKDILSLLIIQAGGRVTSRDASGTLRPTLVAKVGEGTQGASESALRFFTDFANPVKTHYSWNRALQESRQAFAAGDLALYLGYASEEPTIRRINPNLNFGISATPQIRDEDVSMNMARVYGYAIPRASDNQQGALTIAYLLAGKEQSALITQALGIPAARRDVLAEPKTGNEQLIIKQAIIGRTWVDPDPGRTDEIFRDMIQGVTSGAAKITEALQRADRAMGDIIND